MLEKHETTTGLEALRAISRLPVPHPNLKYAHKTHCRIVFKEKGITVDLMQSLPDVMNIFTETVAGATLSRNVSHVSQV